MEQYKSVELLVDYKESEDRSLNISLMLLQPIKKIKKFNRDDGGMEENLINFSPGGDYNVGKTNIPLINGKMICEKDKREIKDGDIIEMRYNPDAGYDMIWEPLKVRSDKLKPQFFTIAYNVWDTIINPITLSMIKGEFNIKSIEDTLEEDAGLYYIKKGASFMTSEPLKKFHNFIKFQLITGTCSIKPVAIMDTSIGQGGDIRKYIQKDINCKFLFGLDINSIDEASRRLFDYRYRKQNTVFIRYDTSKNIENETGYVGTDEEINHSKTMINILYGKNRTIEPEYKSIRSMYDKKAVHKFDVISSQFTLHYYFESEESFKGYISNLTDNCKTGGYLIGTCYDGEKIFNALKDTDKIEYINDFGSPVYSIEKKYDIENFSDKIFGNKIDVYMESIGEVYSEYLVNFDAFTSIMQDHGFDLVKPKMKNQFDIFDGPLNSFETILKKLNSFKNNKNFMKFYPESLELLKNKDLYKLSAFNNYFMFQKK